MPFYFAKRTGYKKKETNMFPLICAREEIRTPKSLRTLPPQGSASTSFATHAFLLMINDKLLMINFFQNYTKD